MIVAVLVLPPDRDAREAILAVHLRGRPVEDVDLDGLATRCEGFSGADLARLCEDAAQRALEDSIAVGTARPIGPLDFDAALVDVRPSTSEWFEVAKSYITYANQSGELDELSAYLRK